MTMKRLTREQFSYLIISNYLCASKSCSRCCQVECDQNYIILCSQTNRAVRGNTYTSCSLNKIEFQSAVAQLHKREATIANRAMWLCYINIMTKALYNTESGCYKYADNCWTIYE